MVACFNDPFSVQGVVTRSQNKENIPKSNEWPRTNITGEEKTSILKNS